MKEKFWKYMDSCWGFWTMVALTMVIGAGYVAGSHKLINWAMKKKQQKEAEYHEQKIH